MSNHHAPGLHVELSADARLSREIRGLPVMAGSHSKPRNRWFKSSPRNHGQAFRDFGIYA